MRFILFALAVACAAPAPAAAADTLDILQPGPDVVLDASPFDVPELPELMSHGELAALRVECLVLPAAPDRAHWPTNAIAAERCMPVPGLRA